MKARRIRSGEWQPLRALRLEALASSPMAYLETHASAAALDEASWRERARSSAENDDLAMFIVENEHATWVGMAGVCLRNGVALLVAVYVAPQARGLGVLELLMAPVTEWARGAWQCSVFLKVHEANMHARRAYGRLGFVETGVTDAYPHAPGGRELEMRIDVGGRGAAVTQT